MTYTENELKEWFAEMKKKYLNSNLFQCLETLEYVMFDKTFDNQDCLEKIKEKG